MPVYIVCSETGLGQLTRCAMTPARNTNRTQRIGTQYCEILQFRVLVQLTKTYEKQ